MIAAKIGVVTVSDRASRGEYEDLGGPAIASYLNEVLTSPWTPVPQVISDDQNLIETTLRELCDKEKCCLVVTTGGTGPALRADLFEEGVRRARGEKSPSHGAHSFPPKM